MKPIIYVDMDGVIADFEAARKEHPLSTVTPYKGRPDKLPGLYENMPCIQEGVDAVKELLTWEKCEVYILSTAPWDNPEAWMHKRLWLEKYFGKAIRKRLILSHHKNLLIGDFLVDDNPWNGAREFGGKWLHFGSEQFPDWTSVLKALHTQIHWDEDHALDMVYNDLLEGLTDEDLGINSEDEKE